MGIRLSALGVVLAAALAALAGCAAADRPMSRAHARAVARAINLTRGNLPTARHFRYAPSAGQRRALAKTERCVGLVPRREALADVNSDQFVTRANTTVASQVTVMRSVDAATRDMAVLASRRARDCYAHDNAGGTPRVTVRPLRAPVGAGPAVRIDVRDRLDGRPVRLVVDQFAFETGPAEVTLVVGKAYRAPDAAFERSLLALLLHNAGQAVP